MNNQFSAIILAGGLNSRMGGQNKAFLKIGSKTILEHLLFTFEKYFSNIFDQILLVTKSPEQYADYNNVKNVKIAKDLYDDRSSLTGIHSGLCHAKNYFSFIVACDTPFIKASLIQLLIDSIEEYEEPDVVIPHYDGYYQPLCAIYSKQCIPFIESLLNARKYRIYDFFNSVKLKTIEKEKLEQADPEMLSFFNVNTPDAFEESLKLEISLIYQT